MSKEYQNVLIGVGFDAQLLLLHNVHILLIILTFFTPQKQKIFY